jgi:hypothetical protein
MHRVSVFYLRLIKPAEEPDPEVEASLGRLARWDVTTSYPLTLKLYDTYVSGYITKTEFSQCLQNIES